jgi:hypothetical protein
MQAQFVGTGNTRWGWSAGPHHARRSFFDRSINGIADPQYRKVSAAECLLVNQRSRALPQGSVVGSPGPNRPVLL